MYYMYDCMCTVEQSAKEVEELERGLAGMKTLSKDNHKAQGWSCNNCVLTLQNHVVGCGLATTSKHFVHIKESCLEMV